MQSILVLSLPNAERGLVSNCILWPDLLGPVLGPTLGGGETGNARD